MNFLDELREEIASDEGVILETYLCSLSHKTVGIGHLCLEGEPEFDLPIGTKVSQSRVNALFEQDIYRTLGDCRQIYDGFDDMPPELQKILANMCFQLGRTRLSKFIKTNEFINKNDLKSASIEMLKSRWAEQTPNRSKRLSQRLVKLAL
ncbi:MAG: hypothetical protein CMP14_08475 [Rickettsiales bacterium]|nr:hypothetical protein [Rickettsiales bacterium]|tara:strand:+ start:1315 stop:1764 length:450 start_codon:yes stop_codon:yes gene_type:complete